MRTAAHVALGLSLSVLFSACSAHRNPFADQVSTVEIEGVQALALNAVFESHEPPATVFPEVNPPRAICLGVGQRGLRSNAQWISQNPRETFWDPSASLRSRLTGAPARIRPLSDCRRDGNDREMVAETGTPMVTYFVSNPNWTTPDAVGVSVSIRGMGRYTMNYSMALRRRQGAWSVWRISCQWARSQCDHFK